MRQDLNDVVPLMARGGADPLPKSLQNVRLRLISDDGNQGDGFALDKAADSPTTDVAADESSELKGEMANPSALDLGTAHFLLRSWMKG